MIEIVCSGSKDLASSSTLLSAPIRWKLARGRISSKLVLTSQFSAETEVERAEWTKEIQRILETPLLPQVSIKLVEIAYLIFFPVQDNNLAVSLNKKRNDSIAFFNRWFQNKSWILYRCLLYMEPKIDSQLCRVPIKPDLSQKHKQHKSQRMKAALPCCCCCSTTKSLSLNVWTLSL